MSVTDAAAAKCVTATPQCPQPPTPKPKTQPRAVPADSLQASVAWSSNAAIAIFSASAIMVSLVLKLMLGAESVVSQIPLIATLMLGGSLLLAELLKKLVALQFGSDLLAGISIVTSILLGEYLVGSIIVLMLSGGTTLEQFATRRASSVLQSLAKRMPRIAHRQQDSNQISDIDVEEIRVGDQLVIFPHEICPVDGSVNSGHSSMNEAYLTGEPFEIAKAPGSGVISGAVNGPNALTIIATKLPVDSRYAQIMKVMEETEASRPPLRRLGDKLGAWYTPFAVAIALAGGLLAGSTHRFLAVMVIATPCPLLIAIPVAIIGAISLAARNGIIIKNAAALEYVGSCRTMILDKTGTLTYGKPVLTGITCGPGFPESQILSYAASLEQYSKHPLASAILAGARDRGVSFQEVERVSEQPGEGLTGVVNRQTIRIVGRGNLARNHTVLAHLPPQADGLECIVLVNEVFAGLMSFEDQPRDESQRFVHHLAPRHRFSKVMLVTGDRASEAQRLGHSVGIDEIFADQSPEEKVRIVADEARRGGTLFVGDGLNDAPAMKAATVGVAFGQSSDITAQAADAVILDPLFRKLDVLMHIGRRTRKIALQSALGGMALSIAGMVAAAMGYLPALAGAVTQEVIDVIVVLNALRVSFQSVELADL